MLARKLHIALLACFAAISAAWAGPALVATPPETCNLRLWLDPETQDLEWRCSGKCELADDADYQMESCGEEVLDVQQGHTRYVCDCVGNTIEFPDACKASYVIIAGTLVWSEPWAGCLDKCGAGASNCRTIKAATVPLGPGHTTACSHCNGLW